MKKTVICQRDSKQLEMSKQVTYFITHVSMHLLISLFPTCAFSLQICYFDGQPKIRLTRFNDKFKDILGFAHFTA